ncbi:unnamed protein product [Lota lota]
MAPIRTLCETTLSVCLCVCLCVCVPLCVSLVKKAQQRMYFLRQLKKFNLPKTMMPSLSPSSHPPSPPGTLLAQPRTRADCSYYVPYPRNYTFIVDEAHACRQGAASPFLVLVVPVAPANKEARDVIRQTWGNRSVVRGRLVQTVFLLGLPTGADAQQLRGKLRVESQQHRDLIQSDFQDHYRNLTIKTMMMLQWLESHCAGASYAMKVDSDVFLNVQNLVRLLLDPGTPRHKYMTGLVWWHSPVLRDPSNRFHVPRQIVADAEYPPYPLGMGYVLSLDLPGALLRASAHVRPLYIEDVYLGMCMKHLGIAPTNPPDGSMFVVDPPVPLGPCRLATVIAVTTTSVSQMVSYWLKSQESHTDC